MPETADTELQFPANFLKSFEISIQRRQNFSISCNNLVKLAMSFSTHLCLRHPHLIEDVRIPASDVYNAHKKRYAEDLSLSVSVGFYFVISAIAF